jgi:hypothetical protein
MDREEDVRTVVQVVHAMLRKPMAHDRPEWLTTLTQVVVPCAAGGLSAQHCYWMIIGYCRTREYLLPSNWPRCMASVLDDVLRLTKPQFPSDFPPLDLLEKTSQLLLELSVQFAGEQPGMWAREVAGVP